MRIFLLTILTFLLNCKPEITSQKPLNNNLNNSLKFNNDLGKNTLKLENNLIEKSIEKYYSKNEFENDLFGFWTSKSINKEQINQFGNEISYTYELFGINNEKIYTFKEIGIKKIYLEKQNEIRGIELALKHMKEKQEITIFLPSFFAYGSLGDKKKILPNSPIIIKLKIININKTKQ